jgi:hypothetical protein
MEKAKDEARKIADGVLSDVEREERPEREIRESMQAPTRKNSGGGSRNKRKSKKKFPARCIYPDCALQYCDHPKKIIKRGRPPKPDVDKFTEPFDAKLEPDHALFLNRSYANGLRFAHVLDIFLVGNEWREGRLPDVDLGPFLGVKPDLGLKLYQTSSFAGNPRGWGRRGNALGLYDSWHITLPLQERLEEFRRRVRRADGRRFSNAEVAWLAFAFYIAWCSRPQKEQGTDWASSLEEYRRIRDRLQTMSRA